MRHSHQSSQHTSVHHKTKTHVVTNTQLMVAVVAAFLAGGLAFVASPNRQPDENSCSVVSMEYGERCRGSRYKGTRFTCSDGTSAMLSDELCRTTSKIQRMVEEACASRQCAAPVAPAAEPVAVPEQPRQERAPAAPEAIGCELGDVRFFNRCGRNQYQGVEITCSNGVVASPEVNCQGIADLQEYANNYCGRLSCSAPAQQAPQNAAEPVNTNTQTQEENTMSDPATLPPEMNNPFTNGVQNPTSPTDAPVVTNIQLMGPLFLEKNDQKVTVRVKMQNLGNVAAGNDAKYTISFLDGNNATIVSYVFALESGLGVGEINYFSSSVTLPLNARLVKVTLDSSISNGQNATLSSIVPPSFFSTSN